MLSNLRIIDEELAGLIQDSKEVTLMVHERSV